MKRGSDVVTQAGGNDRRSDRFGRIGVERASEVDEQAVISDLLGWEQGETRGGRVGGCSSGVIGTVIGDQKGPTAPERYDACGRIRPELPEKIGVASGCVIPVHRMARQRKLR
ncbi:hypothetical protein GCM10022381_14120 [Leifsonia kafniensis]|uniref:Uncharacterized protein n=1 Tax=Leifsonia kafniensis TaxID=475957 RepID=A0ABP7KD95_9MICO